MKETTSIDMRAQSLKFSPVAGAPSAQDVKLASLIECCQTHLVRSQVLQLVFVFLLVFVCAQSFLLIFVFVPV